MEISKRAQNISPSPTLAIDSLAKKMKAEGKDIISFGAGEPDFDTPQNIKDKAVSAIQSGFTKYTPVGGTDELKDAIIRKFQRDNNLTYTKKEIIVSCGAKHSLYNIFQAILNPGDKVIIPAPYWVSYTEMVKMAGGKPVIVQTKEKDGFKITPETLKKKAGTNVKALIINSPSNPTGMIYTKEELQAITDVVLEKGIIVISDEIYEKTIYDNNMFVSIASLGDEIKKNTIVVNGVSKTYAMTGWRIGYAAGDENIIKAVNNIQSHSTSNPASISQKAAVEALNGPQEEVNKMVNEFSERRKNMVKRLNKIKGISCKMPHGAFYVFPRIKKLLGRNFKNREIKSSLDLSSYLLEEMNVAVVPGIAFGNDNYIRLSYAASMENIQKGLDRIEEGIGKLLL
ncbi:MAG: pyridoxal phosphate-dependent aminotransferase [bacterium]